MMIGDFISTVVSQLVEPQGILEEWLLGNGLKSWESLIEFLEKL